MEVTAVLLNTDHGNNNAGEVIGCTPGHATKLCSTSLASGGTLARLATPEEIKASRINPPVAKKQRLIQVRLLTDYKNNNTADDPWYPEREAMGLIDRGSAIRMPESEVAPEPEPEPADKPKRRQRRGALTSPARAVPEATVEK